MRDDERQIADKLITDALTEGLTVSVHDGEATPLVRSTDKPAILDALASTDSDRLVLQTADGVRFGVVLLVYGNEPGVLISDHTDTPHMNALLKGASALAESLEE